MEQSALKHDAAAAGSADVAGIAGVAAAADVSDAADEDGGSSSSASVAAAASAASAPLRVNPRARFIADLYTRVAEARALAAETDTADKALEYHARVHVPKPSDSSYKYAQEIDSDLRRKAEMDREYDAKRSELAERAREAMKRRSRKRSGPSASGTRG